MNELVASNTVGSENGSKNTAAVPVNPSAIKKSRSSIVETTLLFSAIPTIYFGWSIREEEIFTAEFGWGYSLGIIGGVMMLVLMLYPLRKYAKFMRNMGQVRYWFRLHMALGILGPLAILYHSNFSFGSVNSSVALVAMITVACSGVIGRFVYSKIHHGLYGRKATFDELQDHMAQTKHKIEEYFSVSANNLMAPLEHLEKKLAIQDKNLLIGIISLPFLSFHSYNARSQFKRRILIEVNELIQHKKLNIEQAKDVNVTLNAYAQNFSRNVSGMIEFSVYDRIFSLWHMLHLPLFMIMVFTGFFHVYAVHMY